MLPPLYLPPLLTRSRTAWSTLAPSRGGRRRFRSFRAAASCSSTQRRSAASMRTSTASAPRSRRLSAQRGPRYWGNGALHAVAGREASEAREDSASKVRVLGQVRSGLWISHMSLKERIREGVRRPDQFVIGRSAPCAGPGGTRDIPGGAQGGHSSGSESFLLLRASCRLKAIWSAGRAADLPNM